MKITTFLRWLATLVLLTLAVQCFPSAVSRHLGTPTPSATVSWLQEVELCLETEAHATKMMTALLDYPTLGDSVWTNLADAQIARYQEADAALRRITPPDGCQETHELLLSASGDGLLGLEFLLSGILQKDSSQIRASKDFLSSASTKLKLAKLLMQATTS